MASFNLIREPWIPCLMAGGERLSLGIREVVASAHRILELEGDTPPVSAALHRLLITIVHRNVDIQSPEEWAAMWEAGAFDMDAFDDYFGRWEQRFDLFGAKRPFYQVSDLDRRAGRSSARLLFHQAHNATLFSHLREDRPPELAPSEAARLLVGLMAFDVGGTKTGGSARAAPLNRGAVALAKGQNLFQTLALNLCRYFPEEGDPWDFARNRDMPAWEREYETAREERSPDGYLDLLTWQSRRILLMPEEDDFGNTVVRKVAITEGYRIAGTTLYGRETMMAFRQNRRAGTRDDPWPAIRFSEERALWRDSIALFHSTDRGAGSPATLRWLSDLAFEGIIPHSRIVPVDVYGMGVWKAKPLFWRHERLPLPVTYLTDPSIADELSAALEIAEAVGRELEAAIWIVARNMMGMAGERLVGARKDRVSQIAARMGADRIYWTRLELPFRTLVVDLPGARDEHGSYGDDALPEWKRAVGAALWSSFRLATGSLKLSSPNLRAFSVAERRLRRKTGDWLNSSCGRMGHEQGR